MKSTFLEAAKVRLTVAKEVSTRLFNRQVPHILLLHIGAFDALIAASRVGARLDNDFGGPLGEYYNPAYTRLDATVTFRASAASETFLAVSNATDERYDEVAGYPAPGARFTLGTKVDF